jgi:hypothetical protein
MPCLALCDVKRRDGRPEARSSALSGACTIAGLGHVPYEAATAPDFCWPSVSGGVGCQTERCMERLRGSGEMVSKGPRRNVVCPLSAPVSR